MGLGSTTKKIQQMAEIAEKLVARFKELRDEVEALRGQVEDTNDRVQELENRVADQRRLLEAIAEAEGVDVEALDGDDATEAAGETATNAE